MLDTDALTVTHNTPDAEPTVTEFSSDHIKYHLHYSAEYRPDSLRKHINDDTLFSDLDYSVAEAVERQVEKWKAADREYLEALAVGDHHKAQGLESMFRLCVREPIYAAMVYV